MIMSSDPCMDKESFEKWKASRPKPEQPQSYLLSASLNSTGLGQGKTTPPENLGVRHSRFPSPTSQRHRQIVVSSWVLIKVVSMATGYVIAMSSCGLRHKDWVAR